MGIKAALNQQLLSMNIFAINNLFDEKTRRVAREIFISRSKSETGVSTNMEHGKSYFDKKWLSDKQLHLKEDPVILPVLEAIRQRTQTFIRRFAQQPRLKLDWVSCWAIVSQHGMVGRPHSHQGNISGVWYIETGDTGIYGGEIVFHGKKEQSWTPKNNQILIFPSETVHSVKPYTSKVPRVVLPFNFRIVNDCATNNRD